MVNQILLNIVQAIVMFLLSSQIQISELCLLPGRYNYRMRRIQGVTFLAMLLVVGMLLVRYRSEGLHLVILAYVFLALLVWRLSEWLLARWCPRQIAYSSVFRLLVIVALSLLFTYWNLFDLLPFAVVGLSFRNSFFGTVHGKPFWLAYH